MCFIYQMWIETQQVGFLLGKSRIISIFESRKLVLTWNGYFIGKSYSSMEFSSYILFRAIFAYIIYSFIVWHGR